MKLVLLIRNRSARIVFALALLLSTVGHSQVTFTESNLPIFIITTEIDPDTGQPMVIPDDPKIWADLKIIYRPDGSQNYMTDENTPEFLNYDGKIKIELRGSSSQMLEKKQYGWTTYDNEGNKQKVSLLGMPSENDWILNGLAFDASLIRDYLNYNLIRQMGQYATRTHYCEVVINGDYRGLYILQEKIKDDSKRVNIEKIAEGDNDGMNLTGGYITKADKTTGGDPVAWEMDSYAGWTDFIHELPKPEDVTPAQQSYIHGQFTSLETAAASGNTNPATGYTSVIDIPTFVDFMVINEFSSNVDAYQISTFFHKDRGGKLRAGPGWDFNLSLGLDVFGDRSKTDVWQFSNGDNEGPKFWTDLFNNAEFRCYFSRRWNELTQPGQPVNYTSVETFIDDTVLLISDAAAREQLRWGTVPNLAQEITFIKQFTAERITWINNNIGGFSACSDIQVPPLVITKINYNPAVTSEFPIANAQEFLEIKNTGSTTVNLTGVYLRELGISYQFPANAVIGGGQSIFLANDAATFQAKHGIPAFGEFERNLPNSGHTLILADGFGNIIDFVEYSDSSPWPDADGNGSYLQLTDSGLDNSLASSWESSDDANLLSTKPLSGFSNILLYPNPASNILHIRAKDMLTGIEIYDIYGKLIQAVNASGTAADADISDFSAGVYFVKVSGNYGAKTVKVIKQ